MSASAKDGLHCRRVGKRGTYPKPFGWCENWEVLDGDKVLSTGHYSLASARREIKWRREMDAADRRDLEAAKERAYWRDLRAMCEGCAHCNEKARQAERPCCESPAFPTVVPNGDGTFACNQRAATLTQ